WSFNEIDGRVRKADAGGDPLSGFDAQLEGVSRNNPSRLLADGPWQKALKFEGRLFAKASVRGISGNSPRTVAFWVRVPEDTWLSDAYAMVAWRANSNKLGARPVHISRNRNPTEGTVGVLRTDYGRG